ncbi:MAG: CxxC-x17-CxxC domain-containing protein [Candidatus Bathyarchaeia archaeon]
MHEAKCSDCGKTTQVPFAPQAGKPVYCSQCFTKRRFDRKPVTGFGSDSKMMWARNR